MLLMADKPQKTNAKGNRQVNIRFNKMMVERLERIGAPFGMDLTDVVRRAVEQYVAQHDPDLTAKTSHPNPTTRPSHGKERF
jgi:hypothetical protein